MHEIARDVDILWVMCCSALVMLMQAGFCCLETGLVRSKNSINVAIKNLCDFCAASVIFWALGFAVMFGASKAGLIGTSNFFFDGMNQPHLLVFFLFQMMFCGTATTIISGAVAERMRFSGYLVVAVIVSGLIYPVFGHWAWAVGEGGGPAGWLGVRGFVDFAGSTVVHSTGGWVALAAAMVVGPRIGRFESKQPIRGHNLPIATLGVLLMWFGWFGFNGGSMLKISGAVPLILINTCLSASVGGLTGLALSSLTKGRALVEPLICSVIAGLVGVTASCHIITPASAAVIGLVAGFVYFSASICIERLKIDDAVGAVASHACAGVWGTLAVALFGDPASWGTGLDRWGQFVVQLEGVGVCFAWSFGVGFICLWLVDKAVPLRVDADHERMGLNMAEHDATTETIGLLTDMELHRRTGDFSKHVSVEPHTEVGQIATQYNRVLDEVNAKATAMVAARNDALQANKKLERTVDQLQEFNRVAVGRELRMIEMKQQVNDLAQAAGQEQPYDLSFTTRPQPEKPAEPEPSP